MEERWVIYEVGTVILNNTYMNLGCKLVPLHKLGIIFILLLLLTAIDFSLSRSPISLYY
jgi:hypothetical protein